MPKPSAVERTLDALIALRGKPASPEIREQLAQALASRSNLVAAKAADLAASFRFADLGADLSRAFDRFMNDSACLDKGCVAKASVAKAAYELGCDAEEVFLAGVRHVQKEGGFGRPVDTAVQLRGICAFGLVRMNHREAVTELVDLLMDEAPQARTAAVRALGGTGREEGALLLRLKSLAGDREPDVMAECFTALMTLAPQKSLEFVGRFLNDSDPGVRDSAALALGEGRQSRAFDLLRRRWEEHVAPDARPVLLLALAMLRLPESIDLLVKLIATEREKPARDAAAAMRMHRHDEAVRGRVEAAIVARTDERLRQALRDALET